MAFDDSDVKIFKGEEKRAENIDEVSVIAEMSEQRSNGNISRAKNLGKHLAEIFVDEPHLLSDLEKEVGAFSHDESIMYQIKVLLVFTAEYSITHLLPGSLLSHTAVNAMYDTVRKKAFDFYDRLDDAAEYSFYYLAVRKGVNISQNIGTSFAMLCGREKDSEFTTLGARLFEVAGHEIEKIIASCEFVK